MAEDGRRRLISNRARSSDRNIGSNAQLGDPSRENRRCLGVIFVTSEVGSNGLRTNPVGEDGGGTRILREIIPKVDEN